MAEADHLSEPAETELKLQLSPQEIGALKSHRLLAGVPAAQLSIDDVYFDTADHLLRRHRMALRLRRVNDRWLQTLKTETRQQGALTQRGEWETPAGAARGGRGGALSLARLHQSPLPALLAKQKSKPRLRPLFSTHVQRTLWTIERGEATIEVALDVGRINVARKVADSDGEPINEIELELKRGEPAILLETALDLLGADSEAPLALLPLARSKAARGYQLAVRRPAAAIKASAKGFVANLNHKTTTAHTLRAVVAHGLAVLTANIELLLRYDDPEYVHQARVALRRVRSAMRLFDRDHLDVPETLLDELRWFARILGESRDWDVVTDEILPSATEGIGVDGARQLTEKARTRRRQAREDVRSAVQSARYVALILKGELWCLTPSLAPAEALGDAAAPALQRAAKKLFKEARFFAALTPARRHHVRILAKRLRYSMDLFSVALSKQTTKPYVAALAELQDVLGQLNDASVAVTVLPQLSKSGRLRKAVQARFAAVEPERVLDVEQRLLRLSKLDEPWS